MTAVFPLCLRACASARMRACLEVRRHDPDRGARGAARAARQRARPPLLHQALHRAHDHGLSQRGLSPPPPHAFGVLLGVRGGTYALVPVALLPRSIQGQEQGQGEEWEGEKGGRGSCHPVRLLCVSDTLARSSSRHIAKPSAAAVCPRCCCVPALLPCARGVPAYLCLPPQTKVGAYGRSRQALEFITPKSVTTCNLESPLPLRPRFSDPSFTFNPDSFDEPLTMDSPRQQVRCCATDGGDGAAGLATALPPPCHHGVVCGVAGCAGGPRRHRRARYRVVVVGRCTVHGSRGSRTHEHGSLHLHRHLHPCTGLLCFVGGLACTNV